VLSEISQLKNNSTDYQIFAPSMLVLTDSSSKGLSFAQSKYIVDLFEHAQLTDNKIVFGSLAYLTLTHPNIAHDVHVVSQFVSALIIVHQGVFLHILMYLRDQFQSLLLSSMSSLSLCAYCDAN